MQTIYFSPEHIRFRAQVREFLKEQVLPFAADWEDGRSVPKEAWKAFGRLGLLGLLHSKDCGGQEKDLFYSVAFLEELGRTGYAGVRASISVHAYMATHYLAKYGNADLQRNYLAGAIKGESIAALAITEWSAGSDLSRLSTSARLEGGRYVVDGAKTFITNAAIADFFIVAARTELPDQSAKRGNTGISLILVDAKSPGVTTNSQEKIGWHSAGTAEVIFDGVEVSTANVIGKINSGFLYLMRGFQLERLVAAALAVGGAEYCLENTLDYVRQRAAFNAKLSTLQSIRHRLANLATELQSARMLAYHAAWAYQNDELSVTECSMAKLHATELACRIADECLQLQGGQGYLAVSDVARSYRDARAATLAGGTTEIMREIIAQQIIDMGSTS